MTVENLVLGVKNTFLCTVVLCIFHGAQYSKPVRSRLSIIWFLCKNQVFVAPQVKSRYQRPPGAARAHTPGILLLLLVWAILWHCFLRGAHNPELPPSMNLCHNLISRFSLLPIETGRRGPWEWGYSFHRIFCTNQFIFKMVLMWI